MEHIAPSRVPKPPVWRQPALPVYAPQPQAWQLPPETYEQQRWAQAYAQVPPTRIPLLSWNARRAITRTVVLGLIGLLVLAGLVATVLLAMVVGGLVVMGLAACVLGLGVASAARLWTTWRRQP